MKLCSTCSGKGVYQKDVCPTCDGEGVDSPLTFVVGKNNRRKSKEETEQDKS